MSSPTSPTLQIYIQAFTDSQTNLETIKELKKTIEKNSSDLKVYEAAQNKFKEEIQNGQAKINVLEKNIEKHDENIAKMKNALSLVEIRRQALRAKKNENT